MSLVSRAVACRGIGPPQPDRPLVPSPRICCGERPVVQESMGLGEESQGRAGTGELPDLKAAGGGYQSAWPLPPALHPPQLCSPRTSPFPASFLSGFPRGGHRSLGTRALHPWHWAQLAPFLLFIQMFLYPRAGVCRDSGLSCCGILISLLESVSPPLCLTKPVHCFLFITQDSQGRRGARPWGGKWEAGGRLGVG